MKILHVFLFFSLKRGGGTTALLYRLAKTQVQKGHEVTIYTGDYKLDQEYADSLKGVQVIPFKSWLNFGFYLMPGIIREAKRKLKEFDIVHLHCYQSFQNIIIHHYARKYGIPYVVDAHGSVRRFKRKRKLKELFDLIYAYKIMKDASRVIAETELGINEYKDLGVSDDKIVLLQPPFDTEEFLNLPPPGQFRRQFNIKEKHIVMFLGRIHWIKGIDFLIEAFSELTQHRSDIILVIVGPDEGYKPALEKLIGKLNLADKVLFTGFLSGREKLSALVDADVVAQTSRYEQGPGVPFEAVLCGTPIIVSNNSGIGEDVRRIEAGYLVGLGNKKELSNAIQYVLDNPEEALNKTKKAKEYIETNLSMKERVIGYEELYKRCIKENKMNGR